MGNGVMEIRMGDGYRPRKVSSGEFLSFQSDIVSRFSGMGMNGGMVEWVMGHG
jgi:hypothetical protein